MVYACPPKYVVCPSPAFNPPVAVRYLSKFNGSSQPSVVVTTDGPFVVKFRQFTGQNGLLSEVVGAELMTRMGLPVPKWNPIFFTDEFLDANPKLWYKQSSLQGLRPEAGLHFGSRLTLAGNPNYTYGVIPNAWIDRVVNRGDFVGALLLDLWANNCDRRQCLFLPLDGTQCLQAVFIDNDHMLGGFKNDEKTCPRRTMVANENFYRDVWTDLIVARWKSVIDGIDEKCLDSIIAKVPMEWADVPALHFALTELVLRRAKLESLIAEVDNALTHGRFLSVEDPRRAELIC